MNLIYGICTGISIGVILGFLLGLVKSIFRKTYSEKQIKETQKLISRITYALKYLTLLFLILGFIWCVYYLLLSLVFPEQAEYATNMSQLIVSVLTVISIIFAFFEFTRREQNKQP